ncbi:MAG TPA: metallophosphoesterase [Gaiellaceae bacterium]|nr:metallophosphoesterase [Gaiellaceae bacterium]
MSQRLRIAAVGDIHASEDHRDRLGRSFGQVWELADLVLLAGDLTTHGLPDEAAVLADCCRGSDVPVLAVLGNHDHHAGRADEVAGALEDAGIVVLDRGHAIVEAADMEVGIAGTKGFVGGFPGAEIPDFGEALLREVYAETSREVAALEAGLEAIAGCHRRLVLLHYAPISDTIAGEPEGIWAFLGSGRLAAPIGAHRPDVVFHGHAHHGRPSGAIGTVPVHNVARQVSGEDFSFVELAGETPVGEPAIA